ncbi:MAG TPA: phage tail assembly chaperone [Rhizomicrobium sp.]|nr:phage tail assembly chaperone [Rhizomicrobium sp.]
MRYRRADVRGDRGVRCGGDQDERRRGNGPFSWQLVLELGLGALRLAPAIFWAMSLPEWRAALSRLPKRAAPLARSDLEHLMKEFPDG